MGHCWRLGDWRTQPNKISHICEQRKTKIFGWFFLIPLAKSPIAQWETAMAKFQLRNNFFGAL